MYQVIAVPYRGYYIAAYACPMGDLGDRYLGHYRVFAQRPASFWSDGSIASSSSADLSGSPEAATKDAARLAQLQIKKMLGITGRPDTAPVELLPCA